MNDDEFAQELANKLRLANKDRLDKWYKERDKAINFFMGLVMRETKGRADIKKTREILENILSEGVELPDLKQYIQE